ncbi:benzoate 4-monooxygenase cytochrome P450 [Colletotrichum truncatum]|uniref:Benzoate 4-monooxygenase cytochrome P450 n=1 Tax=Colletotrichum truncatum TaxID=5467 RepID=A0ACC3YWC5_COLTU|nr:benzoate 4-monooxygenase cytochrome P450 [Colletotrichum truncatum]KAF6787419.1 benzoate 4-monooxygenase cytochrome P450 [Colletotrichum truncatum]
MSPNQALLSQHPCQWKPGPPGYYFRQQDTREKLVVRQVYNTPGHINYHMIFAIQLRYSLSEADAESRVRKAWIWLRCAQPSIAAVAKGTQMTYTVLLPEDVDAWAAKTFFVHKSAESALSLSAKLAPVSEMQLHFLPTTKELVICTSHEHADGHGVLILLNATVKAIAMPSAAQFERQAERLSPPLDVAADIPTVSSDMIHWTTDLLQKRKARAARPLYILADRPGPGVNEVSTLRMVMSDKDSANILRSAKFHKVSVNDLMNGAVVMATKKCEHVRDGNWLGGVTMDARHLCKPPFSSQEHAATIYFVACPSYIDNPGSILDAVNQIQKQRLAFQENPEALRISQLMLDLVSLSNNKLHSTSPSEKTQSQVEYSGLGKLDVWLAQAHGDVEIMDFWLSLGHYTAAIGVYCYTYRDRLSFTLSYNSGFHSERSMESFMQALKTTISEFITGYAEENAKPC